MRWLKRLVDLFPLTPGGFVLLGLCGFALWKYGVQRSDLLLLVVSGLGLLVGALAVVAVVVTSGAVWWSLRRTPPGGPLELECGFPGTTGFCVSTLWFVPLASVTWTWESPEVKLALETRWGRIHERVTPKRRGLSEAIVRRIEIADPLGVARVAFPIVERRRIRVAPGTGRLENIHVVQGMAGGDSLAHNEGTPTGDRFDMRSYGAGDPIRFVLWKVFARTRELVIREPERAISPIQQTVAYLVTGNEDEAAAGAARVAVLGGALGTDWLLAADGSPEGVRDPRHAMDVIVRSAATPVRQGGVGLSAFLAGSQSMRRAMVFVPPVPGPWIERVEAAARDHGSSRVDVVVCVDGIGASRRGLAAQTLWRAEEAGPTTPADPRALGAVLKRLSRVARSVQVVDRQAGACYPESHLHHLMSRA